MFDHTCTLQALGHKGFRQWIAWPWDILGEKLELIRSTRRLLCTWYCHASEILSCLGNTWTWRGEVQFHTRSAKVANHIG